MEIIEKTIMQRDKRMEPLCLEGKEILLDEIAPRYFSYIIQWRNNKNLNKYLNQPFTLTMERETKWYEETYLNDSTQGFMIMVDKAKSIPFGTIGWTDYDAVKRRCIQGRIMRALPEYRNTSVYREAFQICLEYLYQFVDVIYAHVVVENIASIKLHERLGFQRNFEKIQFPKELNVRGMQQLEFFLQQK